VWAFGCGCGRGCDVGICVGAGVRVCCLLEILSLERGVAVDERDVAELVHHICTEQVTLSIDVRTNAEVTLWSEHV
jgi:hypothetical protein